MFWGIASHRQHARCIYLWVWARLLFLSAPFFDFVKNDVITYREVQFAPTRKLTCTYWQGQVAKLVWRYCDLLWSEGYHDVCGPLTYQGFKLFKLFKPNIFWSLKIFIFISVLELIGWYVHTEVIHCENPNVFEIQQLWSLARVFWAIQHE